MQHPAVEILLFCVSLLGVLCSIFGVPGNFIAAAVMALYWLVADDPRFGAEVVLGAFGLAMSGEVVEALASLWGAKRFGASPAGMVAAVVGSCLGALLGTLLFPLIGTVVGVFAGCFVCTFLAERLLSGREVEPSVQAGLGALLGKALSLAYKYGVGFALLGLLAWRFWLS